MTSLSFCGLVSFLFLDDLENTAIPLAGNLDFERKAGKLEQKKLHQVQNRREV
mgnify:CR=1 FL=1